MKTHVIQLDSHDDFTSIRDKMLWSKTERILLVYPRRSRILGRTLDLQLLQRHALALGAQLAIVAPLEDIRRAAHELGIPVFKSAAIAQRRTWGAKDVVEMPVRREPPPDLRRMQRESIPSEGRWRNLLGIRLAFFTLAVLAVLALLVLFFPSASVGLTPATRMQNLTISASASPKVTTISLSGNLPARLIFTVLERTKTAPVTGSVIIPNTSAAGMVRFRNLTTGTVSIPAGTVIQTTGNSPIQFATTKDGVITAGAGKTLDVPVQSVQAGSSGNLPAEALVAIEGDLGTSLAATNPSPTTGGSDHTAPIQTASDRTRLHEALVTQILDECKSSLPKSIAPEDAYFPDTLAVGQVISETYFPAEGQTGETLSLTMNLQCQAQYGLAADVYILAKLALDANLPDGYETVSSGVTTTNSGVPVTDADGITHWKVQAQRLVRARIDPLAVIELVRGLSPANAGRRLVQSLRLAADPTINLTPAWWPWLPVVPFRIAVSTGE